MESFEIVAHRGIPAEAPENTIASYELALELGADAVEMDIRLTSDQVPIVYHYYYLNKTSSAKGAVFDYSLKEIREMYVHCTQNQSIRPGRISTLAEILDIFSGRIGLEIEIKGPEPEAPQIIGRVLNQFRQHWDTIEVTSYEPALLLAIQELCPSITVDLLYPRTEAWKGPEVILYEAIHLSRLAHARAVHLHPSQLSRGMVASLKNKGFETHAWDVNDETALANVTGSGITRICTDEFRMVKAYLESLSDADHNPASI